MVRDSQFLQVSRAKEPTLFLHTPAEFRYATVRVRPGELDAFVKELTPLWKRLDSVHPVLYQYYATQLSDSSFTQAIRDLAPIVWIAAIIAITVASPLAWVLDNLWLEHLANCVALGPSLIGGSTAALMALAILAVGSRTLRVMEINPVDNLRQE